MIRVSIIVQLILVVNLSAATVINQELESVQVIFRHGDRTPTDREIYPKFGDTSYYDKLGYGQLTDRGKVREYRLGQFLRHRYDGFLDKIYHYHQVYAISSDFDRAKMSLHLVLLGLYAPVIPSEDQIHLNVIPTYYTPHNVDMLLQPTNCPMYSTEIDTVKNSELYKDTMIKHEELFAYLAENTGFNMTSRAVLETTALYQLLTSQDSMNLIPPSWATNDVREEIVEVTKVGYDLLSYTPKLRRLFAGGLIQEFVNNLNLKSNSNTPKMFLYSGHDLNVGAVSRAHGLNQPEIPLYGSAIILEKYRSKNGKEYVQLWLWTGVTEELVELKIPKCLKNCQLDKYEKIMKDVFPTKEENDCLWDITSKEDLRSYYDERWF